MRKCSNFTTKSNRYEKKKFFCVEGKNMSKILIIDDELPIRQWLSFSCSEILEGEDHYIETAQNAIVAMEKLTEQSYDIVYVDIKMPGMNGLELARKIREKNNTTYIVILSSLNDYHYVRDGFSNGANDYILKTEITSDYLTKIINKAYEWKKRVKSLETYYRIENLAKFCEEYTYSKLKNDFFEKWGIKLSGFDYFCFSVMKRKNSKDEIIVPNITNLNRAFTLQYKESLLICMEIPNVKSHLMQYNLTIDYIKKITNMNKDCFFYYGAIKNNINDLVSEIRECFIGLQYSYYIKENIVSLVQEKNDLTDKGKEQRITEAYFNIIDKTRQNNHELLISEINNFFSLLNKLKSLNIDYIKLICTHMVEEIVGKRRFKNSEQYIEHQQKNYTSIMKSESIDELKSIMTTNVETYFNIRPLKTYSKIVNDVMNYIKDHYNTMDGLQEVSDAVAFNPEYVSKVFKKETGENFSTYLNDYRLKKGMELLQQNQKKLYEIAEEVGFTSLSYFSKKFKEKYGINPTKYKDIEI